MTHAMRQAVRAGLIGAAALILAGCAATHVGESWQCPLAQGASCASIADADPAVPAAEAATAPGPSGAALAVRAPLWEPAPAGEVRYAHPQCETGCGPFAWVARWLGLDGDDGTRGANAGAVPSGDGTGRIDGLDPAAGTVAGDAAAGAAEVEPTETAEPSALPALTAAPDAALRSAEVIGRIWIAPFVDGAGVYREGAWVRAVLEPAGWRLP